jgi:hypothetical protein
VKAPLLAKEWREIEDSFEFHAPGCLDGEPYWADDKEEYNEEDFAPLMVYSVTAHAYVLTVNPEMCLVHKHIQAQPHVAPRVISTGYFHVLTPAEMDIDEPEDDMEEYAIEALRVRWGPGMTPRVDALVKNPRKKPATSQAPQHTEASITDKGEELFSVNASIRGTTPYKNSIRNEWSESLRQYHYPDQARPAPPKARTPTQATRIVRLTRHKDVRRRVVPVSPGFTFELIRYCTSSKKLGPA